MKQYKIIIKLTSGDEVRAKVMARNRNDAVSRLKRNEEYADFLGNADIESMEVIPVEIRPIDNERFAVTNVSNKQGWFVVCDLDHLIKVEFKKGHFNDMQRVYPVGEGKPLDVLERDTAMREIADYLQKNFPELI